MNNKKKVLALCNGGNVRSVSLAYFLKETFRYDALAAGLKANSPETIDYLCEWADRIVVFQQKMLDKIPEKYKEKTRLLETGKDIWRQANHPELMHKIYNGLKYLDL